MASAYPDDLARFVEERIAERPEAAAMPGSARALLAGERLRELLAVAYHATFLREEERPVTFRLLAAEPACIPARVREEGPLQVLPFGTQRPLTVQELRRLAPAAKLMRSLVGVGRQNGSLAIWGIVHSGTGWLSPVFGGRRRGDGLPPLPTVLASGPGRLLVGLGDAVVATLRDGRITEPVQDVFSSAWLPALFQDARGDVMRVHGERMAALGVPVRPVGSDVVRMVGQHFVRRLVSTIRAARHGGTLLLVPPACAAGIAHDDSYVRLKYRFDDGAGRRRFRRILLAILERLATTSPGPPGEPVGWEDFATSQDPVIQELEEALFELAHFVATLADVDGAVVLTKTFELVGFGGEIRGELPLVANVARALDAEGHHVDLEPTDAVGTRHRSVYRIASVFPDALCIVVSQDGAARVVHAPGGVVTYWDQFTGFGLDG